MNKTFGFIYHQPSFFAARLVLKIDLAFAQMGVKNLKF